MNRLQKRRTKDLIKALRSGKYKKLKFMFSAYDNKRFCILGLAAHLLSKVHTYHKNCILKYGWKDSHVYLPSLNERRSLMYINDNTDLSFSEIADLIEDEHKVNFFNRMKRKIKKIFKLNSKPA